MLPVIRKRTYYPHRYTNDFFGKDLLSSFFSDGADYTVPAVNIKENEKSFEIEVAAPGVAKEDFKINLEKDVLTVSSEKESKNEVDKDNFMKREFGFNSFSRSFSIPESVNTDKIKASHNNGVLTIELPKIEEAKLKNKKEIKIS